MRLYIKRNIKNMNILLIDKRVQDYETIVAAIDPALAVGVVFDYYEDTFDTVKTRMRELGLGNSIAIGLIQHNYKAPMFNMLASADIVGWNGPYQCFAGEYQFKKCGFVGRDNYRREFLKYRYFRRNQLARIQHRAETATDAQLQ